MEQGADFIPLVSLITYVVVDEKDPAFVNPTKPIGSFFSAAEAEKLDYPTVETPEGFRLNNPKQIRPCWQGIFDVLGGKGVLSTIFLDFPRLSGEKIAFMFGRCYFFHKQHFFPLNRAYYAAETGKYNTIP